MILKINQHDNVSVIDLPDKITMANADATRDALAEMVTAGHHHIILNLEPVCFIDSSGLSVLIATLKRLQPLQGQLTLLSPSQNVRALIELTRLHQVFDIYEDVITAIEDMQTVA